MYRNQKLSEMKLEEVKRNYEELSKGIKSYGIESDMIYKFLAKDHTSKLEYRNIFNMKLSDKGTETSKDSLTYDIIYLTWLKHIVGYWEDKTELLNLYLNSDINLSPMEAYREMNKLIVKIEKRLLILNFTGKDNKVSKVKQKVGLKGEEYEFVRGYWYNKDYAKVRSINFHLKSIDKFVKINEIFKSNGSPIYKEFDFIEKKENYYFVFNDNKIMFDYNINEEDFFRLIIFDIQNKKFKDDYKNFII